MAAILPNIFSFDFHALEFQGEVPSDITALDLITDMLALRRIKHEIAIRGGGFAQITFEIDDVLSLFCRGSAGESQFFAIHKIEVIEGSAVRKVSGGQIPAFQCRKLDPRRSLSTWYRCLSWIVFVYWGPRALACFSTPRVRKA